MPLPSNVIPAANVIPPMDGAAIGKVRRLEAAAATLPQESVATEHLFHAGMYARSMHLPAGMMITGALIRVATVLIVSGDVLIYVGEEARELRGYNVLAASANRKQVFVALSDVHMTMLFPSKTRTVEAAESEFTEEAGNLLSRREPRSNAIHVTGE